MSAPYTSADLLAAIRDHLQSGPDARIVLASYYRPTILGPQHIDRFFEIHASRDVGLRGARGGKAIRLAPEHVLFRRLRVVEKSDS
jgi:hypothetical protein